ncbi:MAG: undecaprenyl-diphosphatase UppP [Gemmatimonadaceae bacterium]|nr:undecaprenyl-diphosphatase UppP [Gemmatimonadaceae bacterium]
MHTPTVLQAFILGILQGLAEFLPISSSAHLSLAPWVFGWEAPGLAFDVSLHLGTLIALLWFFRADWVALTRAGWRIVTTRRIADDDARRVVQLVIATIPGALAGLLLKDLAETVFRTPALTASALIVMGALLWIVDATASRVRALGSVGYRDALLIGLAQCVALVPGVSRSGSTITAGRALGFDRASAARFSFLMSMPITAAAAVIKVPEAVRDGISLPLVVGIVTAAISSAIAISALLKFLQRYSFAVFALYRFVLGAAILALVAARG